jgi:RNA polymerase sigma-70 factor (family 1)
MATESPGESEQEIDLRHMGRIGSGDRRAMQALLDRYWSRLVRYAASIVGSDDAAKDVVQDCFIRVWERRDAWEPTGSVSSYLYRITRNLALNDIRSARVRTDRELEASSDEASTHPEVLDEIHVRREVERAIGALSERRREVFILSRFHGLSYAEIAETLQTSPQTVANQMSSALAELRLALADLLHDD